MNSGDKVKKEEKVELTVIDDPAHSLDFIHDPPADCFQELAVKRIPVCGHEVCGLHSPKSNDLVMNSLVSHHTNCLDRQQCRKCLADLPVQSSCFNLFDEYVVGLPSNADLFL